MMTACDLAAITKPWEIQLKVNMQWFLLHKSGSYCDRMFIKLITNDTAISY